MNDAGLLLPVTALLPLAALLTVGQRSPAAALVLRGLLGVAASLVYALLGAADVALTEALVGTLLATVLYAVALRSSMVVRLGVPPDQPLAAGGEEVLRQWLTEAHLRLELVPLADRRGLNGLLGQGRRLEMAPGPLHTSLGALGGAEAWRRWGGTIGPEDPAPPVKPQP
jgi:putative multicomponent Na+:H+ antiporter subunit B